MTQSDMVLARLRAGWTTALDALNDCGCMRLAARVREFRQDGINVVDRWIEVGGKRFKAYRIVEAA